MSQVNTSEMIHFKSAFNNLFYENFRENKNIQLIFKTFKYEIINLFQNSFNSGPVKYNLKFEATYIIPCKTQLKIKHFKFL